MGAGWVDGTGDEVVCTLTLGLKGAFGIVDGASDDDWRANEGAGLGWGEGVFAEVDSVGVGEEGNVDSLVDDEEGFALDDLFEFHCQVKQVVAGEVFFTELDNVYASFDCQGYLFDQGPVVAEAAIRYQAEGRAWDELKAHPHARIKHGASSNLPP